MQLSKMGKWDRAGFMVAAIAILVLVSTFFTTPSVTGKAFGVDRERDNRPISCDSKLWQRYVYVGQTRILARFDIKMKACWRHIHAKRNPGMVLDKRGYLKVRIYNTGTGDLNGATWNKMERWRPAGWDDRFSVTKQQHIGYRTCVSIVGQKICGPTADFSVGGRFRSPYITKEWKHSDGSAERWQFVWFQGEPGKAPGSFDDNVGMCKTMCR